eukprot:scaffold25337_cov769-Cylindrotheca_fusiformis.AAC.1
MVKLEQDINFMKGDEIVFISGLYGGQTGWINTQEPDHDENLPVIVLMKSGREKVTFVKKDNARRAFTDAPGTYAEAVIQQCPDIERNVVTTTRQLAKCNIARDPQGFHKLLSDKLDEARAWQEKKGSKAFYRNIQYDPPAGY